MIDETKRNQCPIDPACEVDKDGIHKKYHLAPSAHGKVIEKTKRCAFCALDVEKCDDRFEILADDKILFSNVKIVYSKKGVSLRF